MTKNVRVGGGERKAWSRPELKRLSAGSAEANGTGINDGGPLGNARS